MPCIPPFYPSPGHEDRNRHDACAGCYYYVVTKGRIRGVFTNSWIARDLVTRRSDGYHKAFKTWREVLFFWGTECDDGHPPGGCPAFEPLDISLNPSPTTHPAPAPCTIAAPEIHPAPSSATPVASSSATPTASSSSAAPVASSSAAAQCPPEYRYDYGAPPTGFGIWNTDNPTHPVIVYPSASRASSSTSSISSTLSLTDSLFSSPAHSPLLRDSVCVLPPAGPVPAGSPFSRLPPSKTEPLSPQLKKEEPQELFLPVPRVTPSTRIQLSPTGHTRAAALHFGEANPTIMDGTPRRQQHSVSPSPPSTPVAASSDSYTPSVLTTPVPYPNGGVAPAPAPADAVAPAAPPRVRQYGIRRVGIFYSSRESAYAAARSLGLEGSKIMVTDNLEKLEAWITGRPFVGDDGLV
ncbi:hypothetical protein C8R43DRAFT_941707 [Mycena crocata]|nr:hypothetical protein C8R43DRAFT_941707 [Mycena crocata]